MNKDRPVILGYDFVSPLGTELETQWHRAAAGESGISRLTRFPLRDGFPVRIAGQVAEIDIGPYPFLRPREMAHWTSPVFKYALLVVPVSYTHLRAHETRHDLVCRLLLEK